jgi:hypothetical protein
MRSEARVAQWCGLPYEALLELLASDTLATDSEDSVLAALSKWADHNQPSKEQARELVQHALPAAQQRVLLHSAAAALMAVRRGA